MSHSFISIRLDYFRLAGTAVVVAASVAALEMLPCTGPGGLVLARRRVCVVLFVLLIAWVALSSQVLAQALVLADGNARYEIVSLVTDAETTTLPTVSLLPDGTSDFVYSHWWHYRRPSDGREYAIHPMLIDSDPNDNLATLREMAGDFTWDVALRLEDSRTTANWTDLYETWNIQTTQPGVPIDLTLIDYVDIDVLGSSGDDARRIPMLSDDGNVYTSGLQVFDSVAGTGDVIVNYRARNSYVNSYRVDAYGATPSLREQLTDDSVSQFDDSGLPFADGDFTGAMYTELSDFSTASIQRVLQVRPLQTINWTGVTGSFNDPTNWGGSMPDNWRIAHVIGGDATATVNQDVVVRDLNVAGILLSPTVQLNTSSLLGVVNDTYLSLGGRLSVSDGAFYTHSLFNQSGAFEHTNGQVIVDGGTFQPVPDIAEMYEINGATADDVPTVRLLHGAQWTVPGNLNIFNIGVGTNHRGKLMLESGSSIKFAPSMAAADLGIGTNLNGDGEVIVTGPGSRITSSGGVLRTIVGGAGHGTLRITDGGEVASAAVLIDDGGTVELSGGTLVAWPSSVYLFGTLMGSGTVKAESWFGFINGGVVSPGLPNESIGTIDVHGDYIQDGVLEIELGSADRHDQLRITNGDADLGGTLKVTLADLGSGTFIPGLHDTFDLITVTGGSVFNGFDEVEVPYLGTTRSLEPIYSNRGMSLVPQFIDALPDYNQNGIVDAADYTIWRDTLGSRTDLRANGTDEGASFGVVDLADYQIWKSHFGEIAGSDAAVPESTAAVLMAVAIGLALACDGPATSRLRRREPGSFQSFGGEP